MQLSVRFFALLLTLAFAAPAGACTLANWSGKVGTGLSAGSPAQDQRRYSGECALKVLLNNAPSYLLDQNPQQESTYRARFYLFTGDFDLANNGFVEVFAGYAHEANTQPEFSLRLEREDKRPVLLARARDGSSFAESDPVALASGWNAIEVYWQEGVGAATGYLVLHVDDIERARIQGLVNGGRDIDAVRLGAISQSAAQGRLDFDAFSSHRATPVGLLMRGDANGDQKLDAADAVAVARELNDQSLSPGQPDCNRDGRVNQADMQCIALRIINP